MGFRELVVLFGGGAVALALWAACVSWRETEPTAARRFLLLAVLLTLWVAGARLLPGWSGLVLAWGFVAVLGSGMLLLLPLRGESLSTLGTPLPGADERDIMFSRAVLEPGTERFERYYAAHPEYRTRDDFFRLEPGLLAPGSSQYHPQGFPAADAAFWTIEMLRPYAEGGGAEGGGAGLKPGGDRGLEVSAANPETMTRFLKGWTLKLGAHSVGVAELKDYHRYSHVGRGEEYGKRVRLDHTHALALTVEMDKEMVDPAPRSPTVMESARQYLLSGVMAIQLAELIRRLGHDARAHVDGSYRVICPLVARDAGLGEIGRIGLLMTPKLGPRVRIAVVTTDLPLVPDLPFRDPATLDFCLRCRKCADSCPSRALPFGDPVEDEKGVLRWRIDAEACFTLWTKLGTDCARCMAVCPYSHPDNLLHGAVRWGIRRNRWFRKGAVWMDDLVYGRRPPPKALPEWMAGTEAPGPGSRSGSGGDT
ncbi:MAG: 4Fe-4S dicluster domain-containing protein [Longimicrobiales bacterium]